MNADSISMWMTFDLILACYLLPPASVFCKTDVYSAFDIYIILTHVRSGAKSFGSYTMNGERYVHMHTARIRCILQLL